MSNKNQNKPKSKLGSMLSQRKFRFGTYATILTIVVIAVVILLNIAFGAIEKNWALSIDVTAINVTEFEDATYQVVDAIDQDVYIYTIYQPGTASSSRIQVETVLEKYHALNSHIIIGNIDPVTEPTRVTKYAGDTSLTEGSVIVTNADESRIKLIPRSDYYYYQSYSNSTFTFFALEAKMTSALAYVTSTETPRVFFLTGHNELDASNNITLLSKELEKRNYDVSSLNLLTDDVTLVSGDTVIIIDPARDLTDNEYTTLRAWLSDGGRMLFCLDYNVNTENLPNFIRLLDYYQLSYGDGVIYENEGETSNYWNGGRINLVPKMDNEHQITADMASAGVGLIVPQARPINNVDIPESGVSYTKLLTTSSRATVVNGTDESDPGTQTIALSVLKADPTDSKKDVRIVLLDSAYLLADSNLLYYSYNLNFSIGVVDWLVNSNTTVQISTKYISDSVLNIPDATTAWILTAIVVVAIPLIVVITGIIVWAKRRRL